MRTRRERGSRRPAVAGGRGFTLVEILVVIALIAVLAGTVVSGTGMIAGNRMRAAAGLVITAARLAVTRSNTTGHPVRLVFDMDDSRLLMEETADRMLRVKETADEKTTGGSSGGADPATVAEKESLAYADGIVKGPKAPRAKFTAIPLSSADTDGTKGRELGRDVRFRLVQTEHDFKPKDKGRAYLYFWPGGGTERAVIQVERKGSDDVLSVLVSPLTARAKIERGKVDLQAPHEEDDFGSREVPF